MLSNTMPFIIADKDSETMSNIKNMCKTLFEAEVWQDISEAAKEFIQACLTFD